MGHKSPPNLAVTAVVALVVVAALAPTLIALSSALVPLIVVVAIAGVALRLVFFHTRRW
jgi:hypothetical protein